MVTSLLHFLVPSTTTVYHVTIYKLLLTLHKWFLLLAQIGAEQLETVLQAQPELSLKHRNWAQNSCGWYLLESRWRRVASSGC